MTRKLITLIFSAILLMTLANAQTAGGRAVGVVQSISGNTVTLKTDAGAVVTVTVPDTAKIQHATPGQSQPEKISLNQVQTGDRMLVKTSGAEGNAITAAAVLVMKQSDVSQRQQTEMQAWQRGAAGVVTSVDSGSGDIKLKNGPTQLLTVHTTPKTEYLRYAPDSVQFKDAGKSSLTAIKVGDQLRARGKRSSDGNEIDAEQVIAGTFRNIAATVNSVDAAKNTLNVQDLTAKRSVPVKVSAETQMHQIPAPLANRLAAQLRAARNPSTQPPSSQPNAPATSAEPGARPRGDFQQVLSRTPTLNLTDLKKGDAVLIVATEGGTAVALISGVEPLLTAAPNGSGALDLLSNWSLNPQPAGGEASSQ